ncbi:centrosomal protein of 104 kDa isoform X2 [Salarias fasciatus]|uniref:centrosomal protein of 104 kDa isoform X2 n=1 Tax=Salarias fasciatus TaxID=181472 RepID=UPI0011767472|nr:centrosomal protein of 104 kDa isoform X2 [Salarias fasciatus]
MLSIRGMPRKIGFVVIDSSSHEDNFSAKELMVHAPTISGWRSCRQCSFPQHITLQLAERCRVRKLQLLAHQYLIPAKVEFHIGDSLPESSTAGFPGQLRRLGYVSLSDNQKNGFKARELKSVYVDAIGTYLKVTFHRNHPNPCNHHNQVALVAINVLGDSLEGNAFYTLPSREQLIEHYLNSTQLEAALDTTFMGKCDTISPLDDLAFDMYQDPEVAHIIRLLDQKKQDMVRQEKFEQVKNLKQAIADLQKVGERLARYDVEKRCAIEREDYDLAKKKKDLIGEYRRSVYQELEFHNLLDMTMIPKAANLSPSETESPFLPSAGHQFLPVRPVAFPDTFRKEKKTHQSPNSPAENVAPKFSNPPDSALASTAVPKMDIRAAPYDERPLPDLQRRERIAEAVQSPAEELSPKSDSQKPPDSSEMSGEPEPLTEEAHREAGLPIEVFGESLVAGCYSRRWRNREHALQSVLKRLLEASPASPKEELRNTVRAAVFLVKKALLDRATPVLHASLKLLRALLGQVIPSLNLGRHEMTYCLEQTWANLLARNEYWTIHLRTTIPAFILEIAVLSDVRALQMIPCELVKPFKSNFNRRLAQSQAELLEKLLAELGTENSGFTVENVLKFCTSALEHVATNVREVAVRILLAMYRQHRSAVRASLPPDDSVTRKNVLYKTLFDHFARIDGKLVETQTAKNGRRQQDGQKEKEEIHSLQEQLAALKEITERESKSTVEVTDNSESHRVEEESPKAGKAIDSEDPQSKLTDDEDIQQSIQYLDNICIFCGKKDDSFTEDRLDLHYWKHCAMLRRCEQCGQVVEIAGFTEHLLGECENSSKFSRCPRCSEAVAADGLADHVRGPNCNPPVSTKDFNHCPLCHENFMPGEEAWKAHLMGREGCKQNSRRTAASQRTQPAQGITLRKTSSQIKEMPPFPRQSRPIREKYHEQH